jgi:hypothetical protein
MTGKQPGPAKTPKKSLGLCPETDYLEVTEST